MYKKKELIIIISIITLTIFLGFLPLIVNSCDGEEIIEEKEEIEEINENNISVTVKGEINVDSIKLEIPYGYTYGFIISRIQPYLNKYSIISNDYKKRYFESCTIYIESSDDNRLNITEEIPDETKININSAPLDELVKLYGIGNKRAETIIAAREIKKIESFTELRSLIGVSDEIIEVIKEKATL